MSSTQRLVFSFLEFLNSELGSRSEDERESLEVVMECLERVYKVSLANPANVSRFHTEKPLIEIFEPTTMNQTSTPQFPTDEDKDKAEDFKTQGNNLMKDGKFEDAIECYDKAVKLDWTNAVYLCNRAAAYSKLGHHEEAVKNCKQSLELDPKYGKAYGRMGTAYMALEKYQEARDSFATAKELDPSNVLYLNNLETAEEKLRQAKERSSSGPQGMAGQPNFMNSLFSNPGIMNMASQFMANPQMQQMMTNMMAGFSGMTGDDQSGQPTSQPAGQQPTNQPAGGQPAGGQPDSADTTAPESDPGSGGTNPAPAAGPGGYTNIFQFATQMAEQLQQSNPELVNNLRQNMQNMQGGNTDQSDNAEDPSKSGKE